MERQENIQLFPSTYTTIIDNKFKLSLYSNNNKTNLMFYLINIETKMVTKLPASIQGLLKPLAKQYIEVSYFIENDSREYNQIQLAFNLIKLNYQ